MSGISRSLACALGVLLHTQVLAAPTDLSWQELAPAPGEEIANPFEALGFDQMNALRTILSLEAGAEQTGDTEERDRAISMRAELAEQGLDVDALFARRLEIIEARRAAATAVNEAALDRDVRLPGYLLPLEMRDRKVIEFLLVPTVGACIHTPPPPANQVVHVTFPDGIEVTGLYDPVWIEGVLRAEPTVQDVRYIDGESRVEVSYTMQAGDVRPYDTKAE